MGSTNRAAVLAAVLWALGARAEGTPGGPFADAAAPAEEAPTAASEQELARRAAFTFLGELAAGALPMLIGYAAFDHNSCMSFSGCNDWPFAVGGALLPLTLALGGSVPHALLGGRAGPGFGLAGVVSGYLVGLAFMGVISIATGQEWSSAMPAAGAGLLLALGAVGGVVGLEWRHRELLGGARSWSSARLGLTTAAFWIPGAGLSVLLGFLLASINFGPSYGGPNPVFMTLLTVGALATVFVSTFAGWGVHRALGGRGQWWTAFAGLLASASVAALFFGAHVASPPTPGLWHGRETELLMPIGIFTGLIALAGPAVGLEWSHARSDPPPETPAPPPGSEHDLQLSLGPARGGAVVGLGMSF